MHTHAHRREQARLYTLTAHRVSGNFELEKNVEHIKRIRRNSYQKKVGLERTYSVNMAFTYVNNDLRNAVDEIITSLYDLEFVVTNIEDNMQKIEVLNFYTKSYFDILWLFLQNLIHTLGYMERMPGVELLEPCTLSQQDRISEFEEWRTHDFGRGIRFVTRFSKELEDSKNSVGI